MRKDRAMTDETQQPASQPTVNETPPSATAQPDAAAETPSSTLPVEEAAAPTGPRVQVDGDAEKGWLVQVHDGVNARTYSPVDESGQPHAVAADAAAAALALHAEAFEAAAEVETHGLFAALHERLLVAEAAIEKLLGVKANG
jgi:hypothetical protein